MVLEHAPAFQVAGLAQTLQDPIVAGKEFLRRDRIQHVPDLIVRRAYIQMEQALGIALSLGLLQGLLVGQEGGTLGKESGKGPQAKVFHRVRRIVAGATVVEAVHDLTQVLQVVIPSVQGFGAHPLSLRGASALRALR